MSSSHECLLQDLVLLVACKNTEYAIAGLISRIENVLIRPIQSKVFVHIESDPGCLNRSHDFLRSFVRQYKYCMVIFDREGCGKDSGDRALSREQLESHVESLLFENGWNDNAAVIVIDPELDVWVWSDSPHVDICLGWQGRTPGVRDWIKQNKSQFWPEDTAKPVRPKEAMEEALFQVRKPRSSAIYKKLGESVSTERCVDPAFQKFKDTLQLWFPIET